MKWPGAGRALDWAVPLGFGLVLCLTLPLRTAFEFGPDEGFELMKGFLVSRGHPLYTEIWNDQPPLHTELLALLFRVFGPSAYVGRLFTVGFAMLLVGTLYQLAKTQAGRIGGCLAVVLLVSSASFLQLSVSVMLELPAMSLAVTSLWLLLRESAQNRSGSLILSGVAFGCALQIKLTAALFFPALLTGLLVLRQAGKNNERNNETSTRGIALSIEWKRVAIWFGAVAATWIIIALLTREWVTLAIFWQSHFSGGTRRAASTYGHDWHPASLLEDWPLAVSSGLGIMLAVIRRSARMAIPLVLLLTAACFHGEHRPYWYYYDLHFGIPMAWLGGVGVVAWFRLLYACQQRASAMTVAGSGALLLFWSAVVSLILVTVPADFSEKLRRMQSVSAASGHRVVEAFRERSLITQWVFTDQRMAAFWAGLPIPPELAVIPSKRIWSNQINPAAVASSLHRYAPEQVLIPSAWRTNFQIEQHLDDHYESLPEPMAGAGNYYRKK